MRVSLFLVAAFKSRAAKVANGLEAALDGIEVAVNAEKPRKGVFEVRVGDTIIVTTGPEPRPFPALKALDIEEVTKSATDTAKAIWFLG